ncbi:MAG: hypothetical protein CFH06_00848 [Alphaproteobacteria bacterium MarineAlpha3_Bin5]|nr:MAG: hypothetical protein CFH06_00848 [Alphaproteobacteria bacterium MarineAlpha3_Bin5]
MSFLLSFKVMCQTTFPPLEITTLPIQAAFVSIRVPFKSSEPIVISPILIKNKYLLNVK